MTAALSSFFALLVGGVPVAFALGTCGLIYLLMQGAAAPTLASQMFSSLNSSGLLAIPFFILAAEIMSRSGATVRLINLMDTLLRHTRGGLPVVSVLATALFSSICGSSVATAAAMGTVLIPEMIKRGYDRLFAVGLIATAGGLGILIPPSVPLVVYGMVTETSIASLFAAGGLVGLALTLILAVVAYIYGRRSGVAPRPKATFQEIRKAFVASFGVLMSPVIVLGGIYTGIFTPMEAAAVSCVYAIFLALSYNQSLLQTLPMLTSAASMSSVIMLILAGAQLFGYLLTNERVPHEMFLFISSLELSRNELIIAIMLFFLLAGMFLEVISMILITMPILLPVLAGFDINLVFFAVLLVLNMEIAVITPPIGLNLFTISAITKIPVMRVFKGCVPFVIILAVFLAVIALTPGAQSLFELL
jgi:C4-dicarboxylate transporter DctM subunit